MYTYEASYRGRSIKIEVFFYCKGDYIMIYDTIFAGIVRTSI